MTAKSDLLQVLQNASLSKTAMLTDALAIARQHHMGVEYLTKFCFQIGGEEMEKPDSVEMAVSRLVDCTFSGLHHHDQEESTTCSDGESSSCQPKNEQDSTDTPVNVSTNTKLDDLSTMLQALVQSFEEERTAALDREKRLRMQIQELGSEIKQLRCDLNDTRTRSAQSEERLTKQLNDIKSRISSSPKYNKATKNTDARSSASKKLLEESNKNLEFSHDVEKREKKEKNNGNDYGTTSQEEDLDSQLQRVSASAHEADIVQEIVPVYVSETTEQAKPKANTWSKVAAKRSSAKNTTSSSARPSVSKPAVGKLFGAQRTRKQVFYLGGIAPECSVEDIETFASEYCSLLECRMMTSKRTGTQAARIVIAEDEVDKLKAIIWPEHLYLREWHFNVGWGTSHRWEVNEASHSSQ